MRTEPGRRRIAVLASIIIGWTMCLGAATRAQVPDLGVGASLHGKRVLPADSPWNTDISQAPVDPNSDTLLDTIGLDTGLHPDFGTTWDGVPNGIPYIVVPGSQPWIPVIFQYAGESDPGPYPIPGNAPIEGGPNADGDRHVLIVDRDNWTLHELYDAWPSDDFTNWWAGSGALFGLNSNTPRPQGWTSADAAGLPIFPGLVRYDEVAAGEIRHALRFTMPKTQQAYIWPARHMASSITNRKYPPMGARFRLRADFDITGYSKNNQVILTALKRYGMFLADNGSTWFFSGSPDPRWNDDDLHNLTKVKGSDFEAVDESDWQFLADSARVDPTSTK